MLHERDARLNSGEPAAKRHRVGEGDLDPNGLRELRREKLQQLQGWPAVKVYGETDEACKATIEACE